MRRGKRDKNHREIVQALRAVPALTIAETHSTGGGFPDLVLGAKVPVTTLMRLADEDGLIPFNFLVELKNPHRAQGNKNPLTPAQIDFFEDWAGQAAVAESVHDVTRILEGLTP